MHFIDWISTLIVITVLICITILWQRHLPKYPLSKEQKAKIQKYGLIHFTKKENVDSILRDGLLPSPHKAMYKGEKDCVWAYIADPVMIETYKKEIHKKGERSTYDAAIIIRALSEEDIGKLRCRKKPEAIVHIGRLKTTDMSYKILND